MASTAWNCINAFFELEHKKLRHPNKKSHHKRAGSRYPFSKSGSKRAYKAVYNRKARRMLQRGEIVTNAEFNKVRDLLYELL